jgi:hypothetical protein
VEGKGKMKTVKLYEGETFKSKQVFFEVLSLPVQGANIQEMRKRIKILDKIDAADGVLELEDAEYEVLKAAITSNTFRLVHKDIVTIADTLDG